MNPSILAVHFDGESVCIRHDYPKCVAQPEAVLVRVKRAGICETDLQIMRGYMGFKGVLGHEFVGIARFGKYDGRRVVGEINCSCWRCPTCKSGLPTHCPHRSVIGIWNRDGAFAEFVAVPQKNLHPVPDSLSDDEAVFVEPVAAAYQILRQQLVRPGDRVVVLGDGRLGNLCAQVLADFGCRLLVIGKHETKLKLLSDLGLETALLSAAEPTREADVVVDCTGSATGLKTALTFVKPWGTVVLKTTVAGEHSLSLAPIVIDEVRIVGSRCGPFGDAIAGLQAGRVRVKPLISARFALQDAIDALQLAASQPVLKVLLDVGDSE